MQFLDSGIVVPDSGDTREQVRVPNWPILDTLSLWTTFYCLECSLLSGPRVFQPLLVDPTHFQSKKSSQIQWPVPSINAEPVYIFL